MTAPTAPCRLVEVSGAEALWLLEGCSQGRLVHVQRGIPVIRPAVHVLAYGRLIVRTPVPAAVLADAASVTYHAEDIRTAAGTGWMLTVTGPPDVLDYRDDEAAHHRRTLTGWTHGPHDTLLRISPQTVTGFRIARGDA
ncbi:pyridoxamine 5'-phosphate oxidase family protein [Streptomyces sp. NPDC050418]|uniref:pyridoxamine 5'-phosphate oxidase family protein n=1 Tax=Streptomyces sp. NPDC050418 TaxID=3365612 RepID=UPI003787817D